MRTIYVLSLTALIGILIGFAWAEQITLTTYYPAPYGVYKDFATTSKTTLATNTLGTDPEAKVGIGTNAPTAKLEVVGGPIKAADGLILETKNADPDPGVLEEGRMYFLTGDTGSSGTAISSCRELQAIRENTDAGGNIVGDYYLTQDIDCVVEGCSTWDEGKGFEPLMNFTGNFDGKGHTITGLYIYRPSADTEVGLFGTVIGLDSSGSTIENVGLISADIRGTGDVGALVGKAGGPNPVNITNCYSAGTADIFGTSNVGGLVAELEGNLSSCYTEGQVYSSDGAGGLVSENAGTITDCYSKAYVKVHHGHVGGLLKMNSGSHVWTACVTDSYAAGPIDKTGPVCHEPAIPGEVLAYPAALAGYNCGRWEGGSFYDAQTAFSYIDAKHGASARGAMWALGISPSLDYEDIASPTVFGKTTAEMKSSQTFRDAGWDESIWNLVDGEYPTLKMPEAPGSSASYINIGLRVYDGTDIINIGAVEDPANSMLRIYKNGTVYGLPLVDTDDPAASGMRIKLIDPATSTATIKALVEFSRESI